MFFVSVTSFCIWYQASVFAARYGSIVIGVSIVTANFLLKIICKCLQLRQSLNSGIHFPSWRSDEARQPEIDESV